MKPLRHKSNYQIARDPATGHDRILHHQEQMDVLSDKGSVDTESIQRKYFLDCGCDSAVGIGGRCFECGAISCKTCHGRCQHCQKPICLQHSHHLKNDAGETIRVCGRCGETITRTRKITKIKRFLFSPFIQTDK